MLNEEAGYCDAEVGFLGSRGLLEGTCVGTTGKRLFAGEVCVGSIYTKLQFKLKKHVELRGSHRRCAPSPPRGLPVRGPRPAAPPRGLPVHGPRPAASRCAAPAGSALADGKVPFSVFLAVPLGLRSWGTRP